MRKIHNPYADMEGHFCFACAPNNEKGLHMEFFEEGDYILCDWKPQGFLQGFYNILHGGIQATLMDEMASWLVQIKLKTSGVTSSLTVRYLKSVPTNKGAIRLRAKLIGTRRNLADIEVELFDDDGNLCATSKVTYYTFSQKVAREKLHYPAYSTFFKEEKKEKSNQ